MDTEVICADAMVFIVTEVTGGNAIVTVLVCNDVTEVDLTFSEVTGFINIGNELIFCDAVNCEVIAERP